MAKISKLQAAERLIDSAATMIANGTDPLATHLVATSALGVLRDLLDQRGDTFVGQVMKEATYLLAELRLKGEVFEFREIIGLNERIDAIAAAIEAGHICSSDDVPINLGAKEQRKMLRYLVDPANFLKHADRNPLDTLDEDDVNPAAALAHAVTALGMLLPDQPFSPPVRSFLEAEGIL